MSNFLFGPLGGPLELYALVSPLVRQWYVARQGEHSGAMLAIERTAIRTNGRHHPAVVEARIENYFDRHSAFQALDLPQQLVLRPKLTRFGGLGIDWHQIGHAQHPGTGCEDRLQHIAVADVSARDLSTLGRSDDETSTAIGVENGAEH